MSSIATSAIASSRFRRQAGVRFSTIGTISIAGSSQLVLLEQFVEPRGDVEILEQCPDALAPGAGERKEVFGPVNIMAETLCSEDAAAEIERVRPGAVPRKAIFAKAWFNQIDAAQSEQIGPAVGFSGSQHDWILLQT